MPPFWSAECSELMDVGVVPDWTFCAAWEALRAGTVRPCSGAGPAGRAYRGASWSGERLVWAMIGRWGWGVAAGAYGGRTTAVWCTGPEQGKLALQPRA